MPVLWLAVVAWCLWEELWIDVEVAAEAGAAAKATAGKTTPNMANRRLWDGVTGRLQGGTRCWEILQTWSRKQA